MSQIVRSTVNPKWLTREECAQVTENLRPILESLNVPVDPRVWQMRTPDSEIAPFIYTMARYMDQVEPESDWGEAAKRVWSLLEEQAKASASTPLARLV